jgi:hypothetical protein
VAGQALWFDAEAPLAAAGRRRRQAAGRSGSGPRRSPTRRSGGGTTRRLPTEPADWNGRRRDCGRPTAIGPVTYDGDSAQAHGTAAVTPSDARPQDGRRTTAAAPGPGTTAPRRTAEQRPGGRRRDAGAGRGEPSGAPRGAPSCRWCLRGPCPPRPTRRHGLGVNLPVERSCSSTVAPEQWCLRGSFACTRGCSPAQDHRGAHLDRWAASRSATYGAEPSGVVVRRLRRVRRGRAWAGAGRSRPGRGVAARAGAPARAARRPG